MLINHAMAQKHTSTVNLVMLIAKLLFAQITSRVGITGKNDVNTDYQL